MRIKRDIGKGQLCTHRGMERRGGGGEGVLLRILGGDVPHGYLYPDPISDQNCRLPYVFTLSWFP